MFSSSRNWLKLQPRKQFLSWKYWSAINSYSKLLENKWNIPEKNGTSVTPSQFVEAFSIKHSMPKYGSCWQDTSFEGTKLKAQILLSCEKTFNRKVPDSQLGSILTVKDVISFFESPLEPPSNPDTPFQTIDTIRSQDELPHNLSFPKTMTQQALVPKQARTPFQNFDSPKHAKFLTKKEKESRTFKKQRHFIVKGK